MIKNIRLSKGWSQEQLAQFSGLSVRTIQRVERGHSAGLESLKCIAAVLDIDISRITNMPVISNMNFLSAVPILEVSNLPASIKFFSDALKFESRNLNSTTANVFRENSQIQLRSSDKEIIPNFCIIYVKKIATIYTEIASSSTQILENFIDDSDRVREFHINDLDGNTLVFQRHNEE